MGLVFQGKYLPMIYIYIYDYQMKNTQKNVLPSFGCVMIAI